MIIRVRGIPPYDGDYPLNVQAFTVDEQHMVKRLSGLRPAEYVDGFENGDAALVAAMIIIAVRRARPNEQIREAPFLASTLETVEFDVTDEEEGGDPLPASGPADTSMRSGSPSRGGSATPEPIPFPTGVPSSESSESRPSRSAG